MSNANRWNNQVCVLCDKEQIGARHYSQSHGFHLIDYVTVIASAASKHGYTSYRCMACRPERTVADRTFLSAGDAVSHVIRFHEVDVQQDPRVDQGLWRGWGAVAAAESRQASDLRDAVGTAATEAVFPPEPASPEPEPELPVLTWALFDQWATRYIALQEERAQLVVEIASLQSRIEDLTRTVEEQRVKQNKLTGSAVSTEFYKVYEDIRSR